jgi:hypothetical protein
VLASVGDGDEACIFAKFIRDTEALHDYLRSKKLQFLIPKKFNVSQPIPIRS